MRAFSTAGARRLQAFLHFSSSHNRVKRNCALLIIINVDVLEGTVFTTTTTTVLQPLFQDHPGEPVPEENYWTLWCKERLAEADTLTIWLGATPSGLTTAHLQHPPTYFTGRMPFCCPNNSVRALEGTVFSGWRNKLSCFVFVIFRPSD